MIDYNKTGWLLWWLLMRVMIISVSPRVIMLDLELNVQLFLTSVSPTSGVVTFYVYIVIKRFHYCNHYRTFYRPLLKVISELPHRRPEITSMVIHIWSIYLSSLSRQGHCRVYFLQLRLHDSILGHRSISMQSIIMITADVRKCWATIPNDCNDVRNPAMYIHPFIVAGIVVVITMCKFAYGLVMFECLLACKYYCNISYLFDFVHGTWNNTSTIGVCKRQLTIYLKSIKFYHFLMHQLLLSPEKYIHEIRILPKSKLLRTEIKVSS